MHNAIPPPRILVSFPDPFSRIPDLPRATPNFKFKVSHDHCVTCLHLVL